jgi:cephalosporin hydroxylase
MTSAIDPSVYPELHPQSPARAWLACVAYLEAHCNPHWPAPYPLSTLQYCQVLWTLAEALGVRSVLEIGIGPHACSGMIFAHSMGTRGGGVLRSIDVDVARPDPTYRQVAVAQQVDWIVSHGDSLTLMDTLPPGLQVDLLYIDGDHDYAHAYGDTVGYWPYLRPGGYLVIDDYPGCDGVIEARRALEDVGLHFLHLAHHPPHKNGRLLLQKAGLPI